jgi:UDP-N-acetylglucosamine 2-epimerase
VLSVPAQRTAVAGALRRALAPAFRAGLTDMVNPYGDGQVSRRVLAALAEAPSSAMLREKRFVDLPDHEWRAMASPAPLP